jgi:hypothetical protein
MQPSPLRENNEYKMVYFTWFYTLVMFAIPFTILILVNSLVIFAVHRWETHCHLWADLFIQTHIYISSSRWKRLFQSFLINGMHAYVLIKLLLHKHPAIFKNLYDSENIVAGKWITRINRLFCWKRVVFSDLDEFIRNWVCNVTIYEDRNWRRKFRRRWCSSPSFSPFFSATLW